MRMLHVSDWHLGRTVVGHHSRYAEFEAVLAEIADIARDTKPDLIVNTGDLFDRAQPAAADLGLGIRALVELAQVAPTVVVGGNHDSPTLLRALDTLVNALPAGSTEPRRLRFIDTARTPAEGGILTFPAADGHRIRLAPLPFVHRNRAVDGFQRPEEAGLAYARYLREIQQELTAGLREGYVPGRDVLVLAAHLFVESAVPSWSERPLDITQNYACEVEALPDVAYCALGHIHKPQAINRTGITARYAGSPLQLDFGEEGETKSVVLVEAAPGRPTKVETIALRSGRQLMNFTGDLQRLAIQADQIGDAFVKAIIEVDDPGLGLGLSAAVHAIIPQATIVDLDERLPGWQDVPVLDANSTLDPEPELTDLFRDYLTETGIAPQHVDRLQQAFADLLMATDHEDDVPDPVEQILQAALVAHHDHP
ncbi:metallophosphoesterase family protein [Streptosporangium amethystogenes]|uniref:metallophosphoesterase family protein n=1 Tax=Streptosporangium amethystogenes TaxID=2002 RepID=UPI00068AAB40|nr:exonuclease SbcCD subunit D [Streptosporangium amethystogenes]